MIKKLLVWFWMFRVEIALLWLVNHNNILAHDHFLKLSPRLEITDESNVITILLDQKAVCKLYNGYERHFERFNYGSWCKDVWREFQVQRQTQKHISKLDLEARFEPIDE